MKDILKSNSKGSVFKKSTKGGEKVAKGIFRHTQRIIKDVSIRLTFIPQDEVKDIHRKKLRNKRRQKEKIKKINVNKPSTIEGNEVAVDDS